MDPFVCLVNDLGRAEIVLRRLAEDDRDLASILELIGTLEDYKRELGVLIDTAHGLAAELMDAPKATVDGVVWERHRQQRRRNWDSDMLRRMVLDADRRPLADPDTGEIPGDAEVLTKVFGCAGYQARIGALRQLGLDPDEFCQSERTGWRVTRARTGPGKRESDE